MLKTRLILVGTCAVAALLIFQLPKAVVDSETKLAEQPTDSIASHIADHSEAPSELRARIQSFRKQFQPASRNEKNAIFADSLANLYSLANHYDSAAWFAEESASFFGNVKSWTKAGDMYYQAYTLAIDQKKQGLMATKAQEYYQKVITAQPDNHLVKAKMAMTYMTSANPMQGITMLREVLAKDPQNELALFNLGMLSIQSGQYDRAIERLEQLIRINPMHVQGHLLLGLAWMNKGDKENARAEFQKVKEMDKDPAVQATVDSYLNDLK